MLTAEQNERLTRVGPGTPMGGLMRRYWHPVAVDSQLEGAPTRLVTILGETLVLYRDRGGRLGLIGQWCPHIGTNMVYGIPEEEGLRCAYHGWMFDHTGRCVDLGEDMMTPDLALQERVRITAYPVQELGGLIFAYLGPHPAPLLPRWEPLVAQGAVRSVGSWVAPCNWLQCMENQVGDMHVEWLHGRFGNYVLERLGRKDRQRPLPPYVGHSAEAEFNEFDVFEFGMMKRRMGSDDASPIVIPDIQMGNQIQYWVPIDDTHTWSVTYKTHRLPDAIEAPSQQSVPVFDYPSGLDERGHPAWEELDLNAGHDRLMLHARGPIADRTHEELGTGSKGIILLRELLEANISKVERGEDPMGVIRDQARNQCIRLVGEPQGGRGARAGGLIDGQLFGSRIDRYDPVLAELRELARARG